MQRLIPRAIESGAAEGEVLTTVDGQSVWSPLPVSPALVPLTTLSSTGELVFIRSATGALIMVEVTA